MRAGEESTSRRSKEMLVKDGKLMKRTLRILPNRFEQLRRPLLPSALVLQPETIAWARALPFDVLPKSVLTDFPRIANRLASAWHSPSLFRRELQALMLNDRPSRRGFPFKVVKELAELQAYFDELCASLRNEEWRDMVER